ncbi:hypothetical protein GALMADRAFT_495701 [Galerina marginata CBS 339.88]|uniref:Transmembrane protein n=1 Tax=Galerina marginata (strain CBS 339.88) TaxID=685588 RepID=A0A067T6Y8_GALM3|nr:hypothetical protein GALMADRAFT_495701 [Galerina marginata CBS 339.88]
MEETVTQEEQDKEDDKNRREAMRDLVESWMDRLQLISVITTFFASTEASMITITAPTSDGTPISILSQMANIGIMGALVVHSNAAIISFLAAFYLIRYKLKVAKSEEAQATGSKQKEVVESPTAMSTFHGADRAERAPLPSINSEHETDPIPGMVRISSPLSPNRPIYSTNPHLVQVGPFQGHPPTHLLGRCHALCIFLTVLGFVLALMGILCFAWERLPLSVSISASFFMALCMFAGLYIWMEPEPEEGTSSHIYYKGR